MQEHQSDRPPRNDPTRLYTFLAILAEARQRGYGARAFEIARGVYAKRHGECPFYPANKGAA